MKKSGKEMLGIEMDASGRTQQPGHAYLPAWARARLCVDAVGGGRDRATGHPSVI